MFRSFKPQTKITDLFTSQNLPFLKAVFILVALSGAPFSAFLVGNRNHLTISSLLPFMAFYVGVLLCLLTLLICIDAVGRTLVRIFEVNPWGYTLPWTLEVAEYTLYFITFLGAPWVLKTQNHIAVDILVEALPWRVNRYLRPITDLIGFSVCIVLLYFSCKVWWASFNEGVLIYETFIFPEWTILTLAPISFLLMAIILLQRARYPQKHSYQFPKRTGL